MPYTLTIREYVLCVSWRGFTPSELDEIVVHAAERKRATSMPTVYLSRIPADTRVFPDEELRVLLDFLVKMLPSCASIHHVVEGHGFIKSARRSIVTKLALATPNPRSFHTHASMADATAAITTAYGIELHGLADDRSAPPSGEERASSAFRSAHQIATRKAPPSKR